jgi:hypothetical protein
MADNQSNTNSTNEAGKNPQKNLSVTNGDVISRFGLWQYIAELVLAGAVGTGVWLFGEHLVSHGHTFGGSVVNFVAFCIYFATVPITTVKIWPHPKSVWLSFCGFCVLMALAFTFSSRPSTEPKPHFVLSLKIGDSSDSEVFLTNDVLFMYRISKAGDLTNGSVLFRGTANGCLIIPVQPGESNIVFNFIAENDSPIKVNDLEVGIGLPKDWKYGLDSTKWHEAGQHLIIPGWKIVIMNLQFWEAQSPYPLFPTDSLTFPPITNFSVPVYSDPSNEVGLVELYVRSTGFERILAANMLFVRVTSNSFKPFVVRLQKDTNGVFHLSITKKELEDSQK